MTVEELIKELEKYPKDMDVCIEIPKRSDSCNQFYDVSTIKQGYLVEKNGHVVCLTRGKFI